MSFNRYCTPSDGRYGHLPLPSMSQFRPLTAYASQNEKPSSSGNTGSMEALKNMAQHDPFCRACKEFHDWVSRQQRQQQQPPRPSVSQYGSRGMAAKHGCPMDREELGRASWGLLHSMAGYYPDTPTLEQQHEMKQFLHLFTKYFPCRHCSEDFAKLIRDHPPDTSSRRNFARWLCESHNEVNRKIGKPVYDCSLVDKRWHDGWTDGSCD